MTQVTLENQENKEKTGVNCFIFMRSVEDFEGLIFLTNGTICLLFFPFYLKKTVFYVFKKFY